MKALVRQLDSQDPDFFNTLNESIGDRAAPDETVRQAVRNIIGSVQKKGDDALLEFTRKFDHLEVERVSDLEISTDRMKLASEKIDGTVLEAIKSSISRVREYHQKQKEALGAAAGWQYEDSLGNSLGQVIRGVQKVGIYVPGGKASYPSSVIMTTIPAKVAGVEEVIMTVPAPFGEISDVLLATALLCGVDRLYTLGGAQAIAALAYGTETISRVDKIAGPGNIFVATAKSMVFGDVGIDMIAGPSEIVVIADESAKSDWLAMDLFAQAEHDELAQAILISADSRLIDAVNQNMSQRLETMQRKEIIRKSLCACGLLIKTVDIDEAVEIANHIAPEHLELAVEDPDLLLPKVRNAGAIFLGHHSAEVFGDYTAGPSHVLPTSGAARYASPLGVYDFQVRSSMIHCSIPGAEKLSRDAVTLAREEGLEAHALSAHYRSQP